MTRSVGPLAPILRGAGFALGVALLLACTAAVPPPESTLVAPGPDTVDIASSVTLPGPGQQAVLPASPHPFRPGESLRFSVQYGFIHAGSAWLEVPGIREYRGHQVYELLARAESNAFFSRFYKVRERIESSWDPHGRYSLRYFEDRREGKFRQRTDVVFDPDRHVARYSDGAAYPIPPGVQDALSSFYYTRTRPLPLGGSIVFHYHASRKSQPLQVKVLGRERIETPAGTFDCVAVEPILRAGGIFRSTGRLVIWLTADERRMPVLMKSKVIIGSVSVVLQEAKAGS
ncbi:MAG TPA: DUF3108 domain-containing protein [Terriglobales bacterium]|nr:DUF3108 domain-containing protein [Terriglobales bacterium]